MGFRKTLCALLAAASIGLVGCNEDNLEYAFNGYIGKEKVKFYEEGEGSRNYLYIKREDGSQIWFNDNQDNDLKIESVTTQVGTNKTSYHVNSENERVQPIVSEAQTIFDDYLDRITAIQTAPLRTTESRHSDN